MDGLSVGTLGTRPNARKPDHHNRDNGSAAIGSALKKPDAEPREGSDDDDGDS